MSKKKYIIIALFVIFSALLLIFKVKSKIIFSEICNSFSNILNIKNLNSYERKYWISKNKHTKKIYLEKLAIANWEHLLLPKVDYESIELINILSSGIEKAIQAKGFDSNINIKIFEFNYNYVRSVNLKKYLNIFYKDKEIETYTNISYFEFIKQGMGIYKDGFSCNSKLNQSVSMLFTSALMTYGTEKIETYYSRKSNVIIQIHRQAGSCMVQMIFPSPSRLDNLIFAQLTADGPNYDLYIDRILFSYH